MAHKGCHAFRKTITILLQCARSDRECLLQRREDSLSIIPYFIPRTLRHAIAHLLRLGAFPRTRAARADDEDRRPRLSPPRVSHSNAETAPRRSHTRSTLSHRSALSFAPQIDPRLGPHLLGTDEAHRCHPASSSVTRRRSRRPAGLGPDSSGAARGAGPCASRASRRRVGPR